MSGDDPRDPARTWQRHDVLDARLRATLDTVHDGVIVIDDGGVVIDANRAVQALFGRAPEWLIGKNVSVLMAEPERRAHDGHLARYLRTRHGVIIGRGREVSGLHADGTLVPIDLAVNPFEVDGRQYFCGTLRDLRAEKAADEARRNAQEALEAQHQLLNELLAERTARLDTSEQFCRSALDALSSAVAILDAALNIVVVNEAWRTFGEANTLVRGRDVGTSYRAVLDDAATQGHEDAAFVARGIDEVLDGTRKVLSHEYPWDTSTSRRWFSLRATRFLCGRGTFVVLAHDDVSDRRIAHAETARREALLRAVLETAPDAIVMADENGRIELIGRSSSSEYANALLGIPLVDLSPPEDRAEHQRQWARARESDEVVEYEARGPERLGLPRRWYAVRVRRLLLADRLPKLLLFATDITERKTAEAGLAASQEQLRQAQKMEAVGQLAGGIAHDFNNLLTAIRYHVSFGLEQLSETDPVAAELRDVDRAAERATELTRQLLAFSRRQTLEPEILDPSALAEELLPMLRRLLGSRIRIQPAFDPDARWVKVDRGQLHQVITNLVVNARDAIASTGTVTIATRRDRRSDGSECVTLSVADDGSGMSPEVRARIFEPFFSTKGARGTGLGLAMVYGIVTQSGGTITVHSELGKGSRFDIQLPRVEAGPRAGSRPRSAGLSPPHSPREVVLLVEDDAALRKAARRTLEAAGYQTLEARDPMDALRIAADPTCHIDLLLTDVIMPDLSGTELAHRIRALRPGLPVLLASGYAATALQESDLRELWFIAKPFTPRQLLAKIREVLDAAASDDETR